MALSQVPVCFSSFACAFSTVFVFVLLLSCHQTEANTPYPCPVELQANHSNHCECNVLFEIFCYNLEEIPNFRFDNRVYVGLYMEHQNIRGMLHGAFELLAVRKISLNFNSIGDRISVNAFSGLERVLEELHLAECKIETLPENLLAGQRILKVLHLWGNKIGELPDNFFHGTPQLRELSLWGNKISKLSSNSLSGLWKLKKLDLDKNRISHLHEEMFRHLGQLESLYLGGNSITTINSDTFKHLTQLVVLKLNNNGLAYTYQNTFYGLRNLKILGLQNNRLDYLHDDLFNTMTNLTILWLQYNKLAFIWARNFENLRKLQELNLSHNALTKLNDRLLRGCSELSHLFVDHNELKTLRKCTFPRRPRLKIMSIVGNPIRCDCRISWIVDVHRKGTSIWGNCLPKNTAAGTLTSIIDKTNYEKADCALPYRAEDCPRQ